MPETMQDDPNDAVDVQTAVVNAPASCIGSERIAWEHGVADRSVPSNLLRKRVRLDGTAAADDLGSLSLGEEVPDPFAWTFGAVLGARVRLESGWGHSLIGVIYDVRKRQGRTLYAVRVHGGGPLTYYDADGQCFPATRFDFFTPVRVLHEQSASGKTSLGSLSARTPLLAKRWSASAHVGQTVLLENSWAEQEFGVIERFADRTWTLRRADGRLVAYNRCGDQVDPPELDGFRPEWVMPRVALRLWAAGSRWRALRVRLGR